MKRFVYHDMLADKARLIAGSIHLINGFWSGELNLYEGTKECEEDYLVTITFAIPSDPHGVPLWDVPVYQSVLHCVREEEYRWDDDPEEFSWLQKRVFRYFPSRTTQSSGSNKRSQCSDQKPPKGGFSFAQICVSLETEDAKSTLSPRRQSTRNPRILSSSYNFGYPSPLS